jgi:type VI secretion system protein ImpC
MIHDLLILGDFAGRGQDGRAAAQPLAQRRIWQVDRDDLDDVIGRIAPKVSVVVDSAATPAVLELHALDDFHPDRLAQSVPLIQKLRELRTDLAAPGSPSASPRVASSARTADVQGGSLLDQIIGDLPPAPAPLPRAKDDMAEFIDRAMQGHVVREPGVSERERIAQVDAAIAAALRVVLHDPAFQALESLWRAVDLLARRVDTSDALHICLVDVTRAELVDAIESGKLRALLDVPAADGDGPRWSFVVAAHTLGAGDVALVERLASLAGDARVPCVAAAASDLAGVASFGESADPDDWDSATVEGWDAVRRSSGARWLSLALPRFLVRLPYGAKGESCDVVPFEEIDREPPAREALPWANAAFLAALLLAQSAADDEPWATQGTVDGLPFYVRRVDGDAVAIPCAEAFLSQRAVAHLLDRGLTAVSSARDGDAVRLPRIQSIAFPPAPLALRSR